MTTQRRTKKTLNRSETMARIKGRNTKPEVILRGLLRARGLRLSSQAKSPGGRADLGISGLKFALFVDGCFWHGCPEHYVRPRSSTEFWDKKLRQNVDRDRRQTLALDAAGWRVMRIWEHELREDPERVADAVQRSLNSRGNPRPTWRVVRVECIDTSLDLERRHLEELRDGSIQRIEERIRSTRKIGRGGGRVRRP
jgi:DNA mismatch endonuclease (patch repair protein)